MNTTNTLTHYHILNTSNPINLAHYSSTKMFNSFKIIDLFICINDKEEYDNLPDTIIVESSELLNDADFMFKYNDRYFPKVIGILSKSLMEVGENKIFINFLTEEPYKVSYTNQISLYFKDIENGDLIKMEKNYIYINFNLI